jgi:voltage-gated potassium channel
VNTSEIIKKFLWAGLSLAAIIAIGTTAYWFLTGGSYSVLDCLYMTVITISTIGYGEIIDLSGNPLGRIFTMIIAFSGIGVLTYMLLNVTAFIVEGHFNKAFRRKKMEKQASKLNDHFIVCGIEGVGSYVINELRETGRPYVVVDADREKLERALVDVEGQIGIEGEATENDVLARAGIDRARGLFAVSGDDNQNLVISLTAKQMNPAIRVVVRCEELRNIEKMKKVGADAIVSPPFIGGLRMASEMFRPAVVSFLDEMLHQDSEKLRIEESVVPEGMFNRPLSDLKLERYGSLLLMAVRSGGNWIYNPPRDYHMKPGDTIIYMASPGERLLLEKDLGVGS